MTTDPDLALLVDAIAAGEATPAQRARWARLADGQPADGRELRDQVAMALRLRALLARPDERLADRVLGLVAKDRLSSRLRTAANVDRRLGSQRRRAERRAAPSSAVRRAAGLALAAGLVLGVGLLAWNLLAGGPQRPAYAEVVRSDGQSALAIDGRAMTALRQSIPAGARLALATGGAQLDFADGTAVRLAPGTELTAGPDAPGTTLRLAAGRIEASVARQPAGRPLRIATPQAEVTVVGTVFSVAVDPGRTLVAMRSGEVSLAGAAGGAALVLTAGQRAEVRTGGVPTLLPADTAQRSRTVTLLPLADGYTQVREPRTRYGGEPLLAVKGGPAQREARTREIFLRFPLDQLRGSIAQATLHLDAVSPGDATRHALHRAAGGWDEATLCWDTSPVVTAMALATWPVREGGPIRIDVTDAVRQALAPGTTQASAIDWCIRGVDEVGPGGMWAYASREHQREAARPRLVVVLAEP